MDRSKRREDVKASIEYETLCQRHSPEDVNDIVELITDTLCSTRSTIRIGGEDMPAEQVKTRFLTLDCEHITYVFDSLARTPTDIRNIRAYLLTALYNAPVTINSYYQAEVRRDWGH